MTELNFKYYDQNRNIFTLKGSILQYKGIRAIDSSSGTYDGGPDKLILLHPQEIERLNSFLNHLQPSPKNGGKFLKGSSILYWDGHEYYFRYNSPLQKKINELLSCFRDTSIQEIEHRNFTPLVQEKEIHIFLAGVQDIKNIGMAFRVADAFGVKKIILYNPGIDTIDKKIERISRQTTRHIEFEISTDYATHHVQYLADNFCILSVELTNRSIDIRNFDFDQHNKYLIIVGSEQAGISLDILNLSYASIHIPMYGRNSSMNVIQALGISLHSIYQ